MLPAIRDRLKVSDRRLRHALDQKVVPKCRAVSQGRGTPRGIKATDAPSLGLAALMLDKGIRLGEVKRLFNSGWWREHYSEDDGRLYASVQSKSERYTVLELAPPLVRAGTPLTDFSGKTWKTLDPRADDAGSPLLTARVDLEELERRIFPKT